MSDDNLSIDGTLAETTVPDLFRSVIRSSETATVSLETEGRNEVIYFDEGKLVFATSSDPDMGLAEVLLRGGELNLQQYQHAMEKLIVARRIGAMLCELGYLQPEELMRAVERQASAIATDAMARRTGTYTIEFMAALPDGVVSLPLNTDRLVLDGVRRIDYWSLIARGIGRMDRMLEQVPDCDARIFALDLSDEENHVYQLLSEPQSVETLCARSYLSNFETCRTLWALQTIHVIRDAEGAVIEEKRAAMESEYELEASVERYNTAFQKIFGMVFQRIGDHVYDFIDRIIPNLSPETLPYLSGVNLLLNEGRVDFDQLLNNCIASGTTDQTPLVHNVLNELLYAWIIEIKREFGPGMESEVVRLVSSLKR